MTAPIVVDTDVLVDFLREREEAVGFVKENADRIVLSSIVVAELYTGAKGAREETALRDLLSVFRIVPVTAELARAGGMLKREYGKSHGIGLADAVIAATAQAEGAELATLNVKHYPMFKDLQPPYTK